MRVDVLVFGPHPDDIEIGLGGSVARHVDLGYRVGLCDLTRGELSTNGTVKERFEEAQAAAAGPRSGMARKPRVARWRDWP